MNGIACAASRCAAQPSCIAPVSIGIPLHDRGNAAPAVRCYLSLFALHRFIGRDLRDRKKMAAFAYGSARGRTAASNYRLLEPLAGGAAALVQWRLETGRTHPVGLLI